MDAIAYREDFDAGAFVGLANRVWPRQYDLSKATDALRHSTNIGAWHGARLVGSVRVLSDGYLFATVPEVMVDPDYQRQGIGRELMRRAVAVAPSQTLFFGAQAQSVGFFERLGCQRGPVGFVLRQSDVGL